ESPGLQFGRTALSFFLGRGLVLLRSGFLGGLLFLRRGRGQRLLALGGAADVREALGRLHGLALDRLALGRDEALLEAVDAARGVDDALLARVERVRERGDVDLKEGIGLAVLPRDRVLGVDRGARDEGLVGLDVLEDDRAVNGVDALLHGGGNFLD